MIEYIPEELIMWHVIINDFENILYVKCLSRYLCSVSIDRDYAL